MLLHFETTKLKRMWVKLCEQIQGFENHKNTEPIFTFVRFLISQQLVQKYPMRHGLLIDQVSNEKVTQYFTIWPNVVDLMYTLWNDKFLFREF